MEENGIIELINKHIQKEYEITRKKYFDDFFDKNPDASEREAQDRFIDEITDFLKQINRYKPKNEIEKKYADRPFADIFDLFPPEELEKDY